MKFFYNGKQIRTSKTHVYTHAVLTPEGKTFACSSSREGAEKAIQKEASWYEAIAFGYRNAIKAIEAGKKTYTAKEGRRTCTMLVTGTLESNKKGLERIERAIATINCYKIVELEARP